jgi:hypothetical protein
MRFGILLGFLVGAGIASLISTSESAGPEADARPRGVIDKIKRHAEDARTAAREASEQKQEEMLRDWEQSRHSSD